MPSCSLYFYDKDAQAKPGKISTKWCSFTHLQIKVYLTYPLSFPFAYSPTISYVSLYSCISRAKTLSAYTTCLKPTQQEQPEFTEVTRYGLSDLISVFNRDSYSSPIRPDSLLDRPNLPPYTAVVCFSYINEKCRAGLNICTNVGMYYLHFSVLW
jgi:hypothetical protein